MQLLTQVALVDDDELYRETRGAHAVIADIQTASVLTLTGIAKALQARGLGFRQGVPSGSPSKCRGYWRVARALLARRSAILSSVVRGSSGGRKMKLLT